MATVEELKSLLAGLKSRSAVLTDEETAKVTIYAEIEKEEDRLAKVREMKRQTANKDKLLAAKRKVGESGLVEMVDLDADAPGAGCWFVTSPDPQDAELFQQAIKENGRATDNDVRNLIMGSLVDPDPKHGDNGVAIRDIWDRFPFAAQSIFAVVAKLGGLKIEEKKRKSA